MRLELDSLDGPASLDAPLQRLDARLKIVTTLALVVLAVLTPMGAWGPIAAQGLILAFLAGVSAVPPWDLLRRWLGMLGLVAFFAAVIAESHPERETLGRATVAGSILARNALATLATLLLVHVTTTRALFGGMRRLGVPAVMVTTLQLMLRYLTVFADELARMLQARRARSFRRRGGLGPSALASLISVLFLRAVERGDRGALGDGLEGLGRHLADARRARRPMNDGEPAIRVSHLAYRYPDGREALRDVMMSIGAGESVALIGPNGAGKSTLLLHLNGLLPGRERAASLHAHGGRAEAGASGPGSSVAIDGLLVNARNAPEIRRRVGVVFQDPDDQLFAPTVLEDVAFGPLNLGKGRAEARRLALESLGRVDLAEAADRPPHHLSFGERKRVCLAGVLACEPSVLVLDEPTANLDPRGRRRFIALMAGLVATKLIATHDLEMALELCGRAILLDGGRVIADGPIGQILSDEPLLDAHGLEMPLSLKLAPRP